MADASKSLRSADEIAALCDDFVKHVGAYLEWQKITNLTAQTHKPGSLGGQALEEFGTRLVEFDRRKNEEGSWLRENGPTLAAALEQHGFDSSEVLRIVHCAGCSGAAPSIFCRSGKIPRWLCKGLQYNCAAANRRKALAGPQLQKARICLTLDSARLPFLRFAVEPKRPQATVCPFGTCWSCPKVNRFGCQNGRAVTVSGRFGASRQAQNVPLARAT